jgi:hypothetical protein
MPTYVHGGARKRDCRHNYIVAAAVRLPPIDKAMREVAFPILRDLSEHMADAHRAALRAYLKRFAWPLFATYICADGRKLFATTTWRVLYKTNGATNPWNANRSLPAAA